MKIGTKVSVTMGRWRGQTATVIPKKGSNAGKDELHINIYHDDDNTGPKIIIHKSFVKQIK